MGTFKKPEMIPNGMPLLRTGEARSSTREIFSRTARRHNQPARTHVVPGRVTDSLADPDTLPDSHAAANADMAWQEYGMRRRGPTCAFRTRLPRQDPATEQRRETAKRDLAGRPSRRSPAGSTRTMRLAACTGGRSMSMELR